MSDIEKAQRVAQKIGEAVAKKFPKHTLYVRREAVGDSGFIEIALRPDGGGYNSEITTAYSDEFFASATKENMADKAMRVYKDFRANFGQD